MKAKHNQAKYGRSKYAAIGLISKYFKKVIGSPTNKKDAIKIILSNENINLDDSIMIGDSCSDYEAAKENNVFFVFRKTDLNKKLQKKLKCQMIENFIDG